jgi:hypothetical protein
MDGVEKPVRSKAEGLSNKPSDAARRSMPGDNENLSSTGAFTKEAEECSMTCVASRMIAATLRGRDALRWISDDQNRIHAALQCICDREKNRK